MYSYCSISEAKKIVLLWQVLKTLILKFLQLVKSKKNKANMENLKRKEIKILNKKIKIAEIQFKNGEFIEHKNFIFDVDTIIKNRNKKV